MPEDWSLPKALHERGAEQARESIIPAFRVHGDKIERQRINDLFNALHEALHNFEGNKKVPFHVEPDFIKIASVIDACHHDFAIACEDKDSRDNAGTTTR